MFFVPLQKRNQNAENMTKKELKRISNVLDWYEGTDGSEREQPCYEMYVILTGIYNKEIRKLKHGEEKGKD